jgi:hypothetical protein
VSDLLVKLELILSHLKFFVNPQNQAKSIFLKELPKIGVLYYVNRDCHQFQDIQNWGLTGF